MGIKRWVLAIFILVVVSGLLALIFLQSGADERVIEGLLPRVEEKLGVTITYEDVEVSLTSVQFDGVVVTPAGGKHPAALVDRLGIGVRVGPLLAGDLDLTGVRMSGVELRMGEDVSGAEVDEWREIVDRLSGLAGDIKGADPGQGAIKRPDIVISSGRILADDGRFSFELESFKADISGQGGAVLGAEGFELTHGTRRILSGNGAEVIYRTEGARVVATLDRPDFSGPASPSDLVGLIRDVRESAGGLGLFPMSGSGMADGGVAAGDPVEGEENGQGTSGISVKVEVDDGTGTLGTGDGSKGAGDLSLRKVSGDVSISREGAVSSRVSGSMAGTDARWTAGVSWPLEGNPRVTLEVPDMPLSSVGPLMVKSDHVRWGKASADGVLTLELQRGGEQIEFEGEASISGLGIQHERLSPEPIENLNPHLEFKGSYDRGEARFQIERLLVSRGLARVTLRGDVAADRLDFDLTANVPPTACRQIMGAIPSELRKDLAGVQVEGMLALDMRIAIDRESPDDTVLEISLDNRCRITDFGSIKTPDELRRPFSYTGYSEDGSPMRLISGPGTDRWTPYSMISPYVIEAALTTEDGRFRRHEGVTTPELKRAIELNLKKGSLGHGASTITMQLAKNLFLTRERTVTRKLQELFFTWYLESYFNKDEILELYFNVIEFGPSIYGIKEASNHYFGREPHELNLLESVFLVKQLPNPVDRYGTYVRGEASDRKMSSLRRVMSTMRDRGRITQAELQEGLEQTLDFYQEGEPFPEPRIPVAREGGFDVDDDEVYEEEIDDGVSAPQTW